MKFCFVAKRIDNGEWVEGLLGSKRTILVESSLGNIDEIVVLPESVGQYTGLKDKHGVAIFEGDIVRIESEMFEMTGYVAFEQGCFQLIDPACDVYECLWYQPEEMIVLGNIYDNAELLEE